jgi:hypothetical protein
VSKNTAAAPFLRFHFPSILYWHMLIPPDDTYVLTRALAAITENFYSFSWTLQTNASLIPHTCTVKTTSFMILINLLLYVLLFC